MAETSSLADSGGNPEEGGWYQLLYDYGSGVGMLAKDAPYVAADGTEHPDHQRHVQVLGIVERGSGGVGATKDDSVLARWFQRAPTGRITVHHTQFTQEAFGQLFAVGSEPPIFADWKTQQSVSSSGTE